MGCLQMLLLGESWINCTLLIPTQGEEISATDDSNLLHLHKVVEGNDGDRLGNKCWTALRKGYKRAC
ncbi:hypothetical protein KSS87_007407 [Heliosperma pusillum]|nr:hypothetical protein KSS87_007407 [Heliosperma pusillum]